MPTVTRSRNLAVPVVAAALVAAVVASTAVYRAPDPGAALRPVDGADRIVQILQGHGTVLWTSLTGPVSSFTVQGWPSQVADGELGGAIYMERPLDGFAGVIAFGERPMSVTFDIEG